MKQEQRIGGREVRWRENDLPPLLMKKKEVEGWEWEWLLYTWRRSCESFPYDGSDAERSNVIKTGESLIRQTLITFPHSSDA
jgi:hypothetical protein